MTPRKLRTKEVLRPRGQAPDPGPTTLAIDGGLEARRISVGTSKALGATTETWVVHKRGEPGTSVLQVDIFKPRGRLWAAWTGNFTRADKRELAERVAAARNGTGVSEARRYPKPSPPPRRFVSPRAKEGHRVADFNSLDALLRHERDENGAKYTCRSPGSVRIYYPDGKGFKEGVAWQEQGYWHAQAPSERVSVSKPPQGSEAIVGKSLSEARGVSETSGKYGNLRIGTLAKIKKGDQEIWVQVSFKGGSRDNVWYRGSNMLHGEVRSFEFTPKEILKIDRSVGEARRGGSVPSPADRRTARGAEVRGEQYANDQIQSDYFMEWVREQLAEAARMPPEDVLPLETKSDARVIAKNMLQQLEWDAKRDLQEDDAFWRGFRKALDGSREWLADELLSTKNGDQIFKKARVEAPRPKAKRSAPRRR